MPTNIRQRTNSFEVPADIQQSLSTATPKVWRACRSKHADRMDRFSSDSFQSAADAMSAPFVNRFVTYNVPLGDVEAEYRDTIRDHPFIKEYIALAEQEPWSHAYSDRPFS